MGCKLTISVHPSKSPIPKHRKDIPKSPIIVAEASLRKAPKARDTITAPDALDAPDAPDTPEDDTKKEKRSRCNFLSERFVPPVKQKWVPP